MATKQIISTTLQATLLEHPNIAQVHFTGDGHYHFRAFPLGKDMYTRLEDVPEKTKSGLATGKFVKAAIKDVNGAEDKRFKVVETVSREEVLKAAAVDIKTSSIITKEDILAQLEVTPEELAAFLKSRKK